MTHPTQHTATRLIHTLLLCGCDCGRRLIDNGKPREGTVIVASGQDGTPVKAVCRECDESGRTS
ncbi:MAG: hypothetical protein L0211_05450 [Planctomycetaceae bacterium]|nr:hypothetical protein [Planctomycetaceae bacterium]